MSRWEKMRRTGRAVTRLSETSRPPHAVAREPAWLEPLERRVLMAFGPVAINFQPAGAPVPAGFVADTGAVYGSRGNGYTYGWDQLNDGDNARDRNAANSPNQQYDTLIHLQNDGADRRWEIAVPNGSYRVRLVAGDPSYFNSVYRLNVEQTLIVDGTPTSANRWVEGNGVVTVADGRLTVSNAAGSSNNKVNFIEIASTDAVTQPSIAGTTPTNGQTNVGRDAFVGADMFLPNGALDAATVTTANVSLRRAGDNAVVPAVVNTSGGGDDIVLQPSTLLDANTRYIFAATSGVKDVSGAALVPFEMSFTTGTSGGPVQSDIQFNKTAQAGTQGTNWTTLAVGPDRRLYAGAIDGRIVRFPINADGSLGTGQTITTLQTANGGPRMLLGLVFDPAATASNPVVWATHGHFSFDADALPWSGKVTKLSGANLQTVQDVVVGLPRTGHNHLTNQAVFGPDGALYISQGSMSAQGAADATWALRDEVLLSAAVLRLDTTKITPGSPLNARTYDGGGPYNPWAAGAPLTIYASGIRNAYDLVWTHDGRLYVPTNGSNAGGNAPGTPALPIPGSIRLDGDNDGNAANGHYSSPAVPALRPVNSGQNDYLYLAERGGYYGHPNPSRFEFVLNGGNPTSGTDPAEITQYPVGTQPDRNYRGFAHDFGAKLSPDGIIEYRSSTAFGGALRGKLLVARYSGRDDILILSRGENGAITAEQAGVTGLTGFADPLDLVEDPANGNLYVAEYAEHQSTPPQISLLRPASVSSTPAPAEPLENQTVGGPAPAGSTSVLTPRRDYNITAGGRGVGGTRDAFRFTYELLSGDFDIKTRVTALSGGSSAVAGLDARDGLSADARNVFAGLTAGSAGGYRLSYRGTTGGTARDLYKAGTANFGSGAWVRLVREGNVFTGYRSTDGTNWVSTGRVPMSLPRTLYVGFATSSGSTTATTTAQYRQASGFSGPAAVAPATPTGLAAQAVSGTQINVSWNASAGATGYTVQRRGPGQATFTDYRTIAGGTNTAFQDTNLQPNSTYAYQVRAVNGLLTSAYTQPVQATTPNVPVAFFTSADIGASPAGSTTVVAEGRDYNVSGGGPNIGSTADGFRFLYRPHTGDFDVRVRIESFSGPSNSAKAGIMARADETSPGAANVAALVTKADTRRFTCRTTAGGTTTSVERATVAYPEEWVRLRRVGNVFTAFHGSYGDDWAEAGQVTLALPQTLYLGLAVSSASGATSGPATAQFRQYGNWVAPLVSPTTITWANGPTAPRAKQETGVAQIGNKLYVIGGYAEGLTGSSDAHVLNLDTNQWSAIASLPAGVPQTHAGVATDGARFIYWVAGQFGNGGSTDIHTQSWKYDVTNNTWSQFTPLPEARGGGGMVYFNGKLHWFGGFVSDRITDSDKHWAISVDANGNATSAWTPRAPLPDTGDHLSGAALNGKIYAIGGEHDHGVTYAQHDFLIEYDPAADRWAHRAPLPVASSHFEGGVHTVHGRLMVVGGQRDQEELLDDIRVWDPATDRWSLMTSLPLVRKGGASAFYNDRFWYTSGKGNNSDGREAYQQNTWIGSFNNPWWTAGVGTADDGTTSGKKARRNPPLRIIDEGTPLAAPEEVC